MFESLSDHLDSGKWEEKSDADKKDGEFQEYHVNRQHKVVNDTTYSYLVAVEDGDPISVELFNCNRKTDPLKGVGTVELKLDPEQKEILGIDLNGDVVMKKKR